MQSLICSGLFALLIPFAGAIAEELTGTYRGRFPAPDGSMVEVTFELKAEGNSLTGVVFFNGKETPITNGRVEGDKLRIVCTKVWYHNSKATFEGSFTGDKISFEQRLEGSDQVVKFTVIRQQPVGTIRQGTGMQKG